MERISAEEISAIAANKRYDKYPHERIFDDAKYYFETMKSAPFFGEETLGKYVDIYKDLGKLGYSPALYELGLLYYNGEFWLPTDLEKSLEYHKRSAALGNTDAQFELYVYYSTGIGVDINLETAMEWCNTAANGGHPRATYNLGAFYATGNGVPQDMELSVKWYAESSKNGNSEATKTLKLMYLFGEGVAQDDKKALEYEAIEKEQRAAFAKKMWG